MLRAHIIGSGFVTGEHKVTNAQMLRMVDTSDEWIRERTGIEERYFVKDGTTTSDLGARAAEKAMQDAGVSKEEIDYVVFATMTPDYYFPGCGGLVQKKLGLHNVPALDIRQQCTGFLFGLQVSDAVIRSGQAKTVLLIGAEVHSGFMPWRCWDHLFGLSEDGPTADEVAAASQLRDRTVLFGDAAGAVVLRAGGDERGLLGFSLHSDGGGIEDLYVPGVGFAHRPYVTHKQIDEGMPMPMMNGKAVFRMAVTKIPETVHELCAAAGLGVEQIDLLIPHQANLRINKMVQKVLKLPDERIYNNIQRYGNTTAATIPIAFDECRKSGRIKPGDLVCFVGLGAGFHWGAVLLRA
ncbi:MAG: 3-oxoacyl-ACP synthase III family protein [Myxococcales bacterium]|jgi:3-oxoacyl-[acyl-carrier-protein] synthase-3